MAVLWDHSGPAAVVAFAAEIAAGRNGQDPLAIHLGAGLPGEVAVGSHRRDRQRRNRRRRATIRRPRRDDAANIPAAPTALPRSSAAVAATPRSSSTFRATSRKSIRRTSICLVKTLARASRRRNVDAGHADHQPPRARRSFVQQSRLRGRRPGPVFQPGRRFLSFATPFGTNCCKRTRPGCCTWGCTPIASSFCSN